MNKIQEQSEKINEERKKFVPFESAVEIPLGISALKDDGSYKCRIEAADNEQVYTSSDDPKYHLISFKDLYKNWIFELQPGQILIAGKPDDSGIIIP